MSTRRKDVEDIAETLGRLRNHPPAVRDAIRKRAKVIRQQLEERDTVTGSLIAEWREARSMSQTELGKRLNKAIDGSAVSFYERGKSSPSVRQLLNILGGLDIPGANDRERLSNFFLGPTAKRGPSTTQQPEIDLIVRVVAATLAEQARQQQRQE